MEKKLTDIDKKNLMYNYQDWITESDPSILFRILDHSIRSAGYTVLKHVEHYFQPEGYTCLWLLAESHLAVHTFPEKKQSYIELSGCNKEKNIKFIRLLKENALITI